MSVIPGTHKAAEGLTEDSPLKVARGDYDFAVDGGAVGTIGLIGSAVIPAGAIIICGFIDVLTTLTSGGAATIAVQVESAGDIVAATGVASWTAGLKNVLPAMTSGSITAATAVKTTAARDISVVIGAAALTAGKFRVVLHYLEPLP